MEQQTRPEKAASPLQYQAQAREICPQISQSQQMLYKRYACSCPIWVLPKIQNGELLSPLHVYAISTIFWHEGRWPRRTTTIPHPTERSQSRRGSATINGTSNSLDTYPRHEINIMLCWTSRTDSHGRRSRARRQEHLADLERRLADCHNACREADLQRGTLKELQIENARLRELLALAGVSSTFIDTYISQGSEHNDPSLRQLKPKLALENGHPTLRSADACLQAAKCSQTCRQSTSSHSTDLERNLDSKASVLNGILPSLPDNRWLTQSAVYRPGISNPRQGAILPPKVLGNSFCCDSFHVPPNGPLLQATEDTILCSVAKELIEQYCLNVDQMEIIKARLATGFCKPAVPGQGCRVSNQLFFEVLNDISSK